MTIALIFIAVWVSAIIIAWCVYDRHEAPEMLQAILLTGGLSFITFLWTVMTENRHDNQKTVVKRLEKLYTQFIHASPAQKKIFANIVLQIIEDIDTGKLPTNLTDFIEQAKTINKEVSL
jgi:hypothetical protein